MTVVAAVAHGDDRAWVVEADEVVLSAPPYLDIRRQRVRTNSGQVVDDYYQIDVPDFVIGCALTEAGQVIALWQYKHGLGAWGLTFPAGMIDPGETSEAGMVRELREETGYVAGGSRLLGSYACNSNQGAGRANLFLLTSCRRVTEAQSGDLETMDLRLMSIAEVDAAVTGGEVHGLPHLAVWTAARHMCQDAFVI